MKCTTKQTIELAAGSDSLCQTVDWTETIGGVEAPLQIQ